MKGATSQKKKFVFVSHKRVVHSQSTEHVLHKINAKQTLAYKAHELDLRTTQLRQSWRILLQCARANGDFNFGMMWSA